jgi:hypothetical protein
VLGRWPRRWSGASTRSTALWSSREQRRVAVPVAPTFSSLRKAPVLVPNLNLLTSRVTTAARRPFVGGLICATC